MAELLEYSHQRGASKLAGIDAGSNAIRLVIAKSSSNTFTPLARRRCAVRLGHGVFTDGELDERAVDRAVEAFLEFGIMMDRHGVERYRAVATSASREARNGDHLLKRIRQEAGIAVNIIDAAEEARLTQLAILAALDKGASPELIVDIGGGSVELSLLDKGRLKLSHTLPIGTVRLMEGLGLPGRLSKKDCRSLRRHLQAILRQELSADWRPIKGVAAACGGNAEELARLAPGSPDGSTPTLDLEVLATMMPSLVARDVSTRIKAYGVRKDRAEVMAIAAVVLQELGNRLEVKRYRVPGVGVREGILLDLCQPVEHRLMNGTGRSLLQEARRFAERSGCHSRHVEQVCRLSLSLFDQLSFLHRLDEDARILLELGAVLHDVGRFMSPSKHHKHGEYMVRHSQLPGLNGRLRPMLACLVRYHTKSKPSRKHKGYGTLRPGERSRVRVLASILRIAEGLDLRHDQAVDELEVTANGENLSLDIGDRVAALLADGELQQRAKYFEELFGVDISFETGKSAVA